MKVWRTLWILIGVGFAALWFTLVFIVPMAMVSMSQQNLTMPFSVAVLFVLSNHARTPLGLMFTMLLVWGYFKVLNVLFSRRSGSE